MKEKLSEKVDWQILCRTVLGEGAKTRKALALEADQTGTTDQEQLTFSVEQARTIYTFNVGDFARLHRDWLQQGRDHCGIVVIPDQRYSIGDKIRRLAGLAATVTAEEMVNRMEYL